ncbi:uncharacterized protein BX663DRAFT_500450 [Cokeromyces recurvatus]|uniref:uncharacterized protein n=1 Tax=Cokeromyces recurvatus TaxID=90255 RepID=UPI0022205683|nr:uncharacterized protein BX663DRAFT_500450 [Cokeromyces recurvatus]KAI7905641.1 hypothetical protein BX663DRAFT_500450 [Cokeromyces recurvatus]
MNEQDIVKFCEITSASTEVAKRFLEIADNHFETAVTLYLENEGADIANSSHHNHSNSSSSSVPRSTSGDNIMSDEELARQMQEKENEVRAPIASKTDILTGGSPSGIYHTPSLWPQRDPVGISRPSVFNQGDSTTGSVTDFLNRLQPDEYSRSISGSPSESIISSPSTAKAKRLADLFRPPFDIMFRGSFEEARETAKEKNKWLMINIQDPTEFACQVLNRDLWSDTFVKDIVRESFIFLQYSNKSSEGTRYNTLYSISKYPHVAIIDARTGERMKFWESELTPTDFMMDVTEFLEQNLSGPTGSRSLSNMKRPRVSKNINEMSEEEQLNAAIAASLNNIKQSNETAALPPILSNNDNEVDKKEEIKEEEEEKEEIKAGSAFDAIKAIKREEPTDMTNSTRIQFRMGDGSRIIRRFLKTDPVRSMFEFIKAEVSDAKEQSFEVNKSKKRKKN